MGYHKSIEQIVVENSCIQVLSMAFSEWKLVDVIMKQKSECSCGHVIYEDFIIMNMVTLERLHIGCCCVNSFVGTQVGDEIVATHKMIESKERLYDSLFEILTTH